VRVFEFGIRNVECGVKDSEDVAKVGGLGPMEVRGWRQKNLRIKWERLGWFSSLGSKCEPQNIECLILNVEGWNRFAQSFLKIDRIHSFVTLSPPTVEKVRSELKFKVPKVKESLRFIVFLYS
jgi:hypothetical protein